MNRIALQIVAVIMALTVCLVPVAWAAEQDNSPNPAADLGLGVASFICSLPYGAVKVATALLGGIVGGFTYVMSGLDKRAANAVWYTTIEGDYLVTTEHLRGKKDLRFTGVPPTRTSDGR